MQAFVTELLTVLGIVAAAQAEVSEGPSECTGLSIDIVTNGLEPMQILLRCLHFVPFWEMTTQLQDVAVCAVSYVRVRSCTPC